MIYPKYKYVIAGVDIVLILLSYAIAINLRFGGSSNVFRLNGYEFIIASDNRDDLRSRAPIHISIAQSI